MNTISTHLHSVAKQPDTSDTYLVFIIYFVMTLRLVLSQLFKLYRIIFKAQDLNFKLPDQLDMDKLPLQLSNLFEIQSKTL